MNGDAMTTTPTGPRVTNEMVLAAVRIARDRGYDTPSHLVNPMLKAALAAMPAAEPTTLFTRRHVVQDLISTLEKEKTEYNGHNERKLCPEGHIHNVLSGWYPEGPTDNTSDNPVLDWLRFHLPTPELDDPIGLLHDVADAAFSLGDDITNRVKELERSVAWIIHDRKREADTHDAALAELREKLDGLVERGDLVFAGIQNSAPVYALQQRMRYLEGNGDPPDPAPDECCATCHDPLHEDERDGRGICWTCYDRQKVDCACGEVVHPDEFTGEGGCPDCGAPLSVEDDGLSHHIEHMTVTVDEMSWYLGEITNHAGMKQRVSGATWGAFVAKANQEAERWSALRDGR